MHLSLEISPLVGTILMISPQMVTERHYQLVERQLYVVERQFQVVERQTQVAECRSGPFRLNLITGEPIGNHDRSFKWCHL